MEKDTKNNYIVFNVIAVRSGQLSSVVTEVQPRRPGIRSLISGRDTSLSFIHIVHAGSGAHAVSYPIDIRSSFSVGKAIGTIIRSLAYITWKS
jgi:hypothetical protein